jgi:hypothetical protein
MSDSREQPATNDVDAGSYEVVRGRLLANVATLGGRAEQLNDARKALYGASTLELTRSTRIRTANAAHARDLVSVALGQDSRLLLFAFHVTLGLKSQPTVGDVLALYKLTADEAPELEPLPLAGTFLDHPAFVSDFTTAFRYAKDARILKLRRTDTRLLIIVQIGEKLSDVRVFRFSVDARGEIVYIDARGEEDNVAPPSHAFRWTKTGREQQVMGAHPHINVLDEVFVETIGGDLTVKVENNAKDGRGIWREPVSDPNQTLDDAEISYARVGKLLLLKVLPYREESHRYLVYNTLKKRVTRIDAIGAACLELPEDQGILFPGGHYVAADEARVVDTDTAGMQFESVLRAPNGEDVLYIFYREDEGLYLLLPYNGITKELGAPMRAHGYSLFSDGTLALFRAPEGAEPTRVHPFQLWKTPFQSLENADAAARARGATSYLAKVGNASLVRGIGDAYAIRKLALTEEPTRRTYEELVSATNRAMDDHYWIGHEEAFDLKSALKEVRKSADGILQEFEKVEAYRAQAAAAIVDATSAQEAVLRGKRPEDSPSAESFLDALAALRSQRGKLVSLRELRYVDLLAIDALEKAVDGRFDEVRVACVDFFEADSAWAPVLAALEATATAVEKTEKTVDLAPLKARLEELHSRLLLLGETVSGLDVDDPTKRTRVLEQLSRTLAVANRAKAVFETRRKELYGREGRAELAVQLGVFAQAVGAAVSSCTTPEACDAELGKLLLRVEELATRFGELDEFAIEIDKKREEVAETFGARRQTLTDERHKRAATLAEGGERLLQGVARKAATFTKEEDLLAYFAADPMVRKITDSAAKLAALGENVRADELATRLKTARQDAVRKLRDARELSDGDGVKLGGFTFSVTKSAIDLVLVPRSGAGGDAGPTAELVLHLTGTDFHTPLAQAAPERISAFEALAEVWEQSLASEGAEVYRGEYLAFQLLQNAFDGRPASPPLATLRAAIREDRLGPLVAEQAAQRLDEGYERGVHDVDATRILTQVLPAFDAAGPLRFAPEARAIALRFVCDLPAEPRAVLVRQAQSVARLAALFSDGRGVAALKRELLGAVSAFAARFDDFPTTAEILGDSADLIVETLAQKIPRFPVARASDEGAKLLRRKLDDAGEYRALQDELELLASHPREAARLALHYACSLEHSLPHLGNYAPEIAAILLTDGRVDRETLSAETTVEVTGLLGTHPRIRDGAIALELAEYLNRVRHFETVIAGRFRRYRRLRSELLSEQRARLRLEEFVPKVLSSFVRNRLIDEVYLPLVGTNLAKQIGATGAAQRTDRMGLLFLVSPPGYGKTTLMEYVASVLGLVFVKVNGPALGHDVHSLDPAECKSLTARQEVERINLGFEMGNNVMLYVDDVQHTSPEFLEKFISLCDAQRKVEGVWNGRSRTYDFRGKRFCVVMAANPYTESGARFRIPDMLANRADTYNLGEVLGGKQDLFALSYLENALTSHPALAPLSGRAPGDLYKLVRMAEGESIPASELSHGYSGAELTDLLAMLRLVAKVQKVLLAVNQAYIRSASQEDAYRSEPPFKLQGSYRNMNKIVQKLAPVMTDDELERAIDEHYAAESQTLATGAEQNLLKLAELRDRMTGGERTRWETIKETYLRTKRGGKDGDDPVARITGTLGGLEEQLQVLNKAVAAATASGAAREAHGAEAFAAALGRIGDALGKPNAQSVNVTLAAPSPQLVELEAIMQLGQAMADAVARSPGGAAGGPNAQAPQAILEQLSRLEKLVQARGGTPIAVDLRPGDATNFTCNVDGKITGVFVATYAKAPALGSDVPLQLVFPGDATAAARGIVSATQDEDGDRPAGFAVTFTELATEGQTLAARYARSRPPTLRA